MAVFYQILKNVGVGVGDEMTRSTRNPCGSKLI